MLTLAIDTSTNILSLGLVREGTVLACFDEQTKNNQSAILMSKIQTMLAENNFSPIDLTEIAVAIGPGSYTGIRVGVAAAKSLGYALKIPVIGVSSLAVMAKATHVDTGIIVPMIDARRGTVFAAAYNAKGTVLIKENHYELYDLLSKLKQFTDNVTFVGDVVVESEAVTPETEFAVSKASALAELARNMEKEKNIHQLVPNYLRKTEAEANLGE